MCFTHDCAPFSLPGWQATADRTCKFLACFDLREHTSILQSPLRVLGFKQVLIPSGKSTLNDSGSILISSSRETSPECMVVCFVKLLQRIHTLLEGLTVYSVQIAGSSRR